MATTIDRGDLTYALLGAITKIETEPDGSVSVYGKATDGTIDSDEQIVDPEFADRGMAKWFGTKANVRQMHSTNMPPAGKGIQLVSQPDGQFVRVKVVEPTAALLVREGVYSDFSVGIAKPRIVRDKNARGGRIVDGEIVEISLVDRGANYNAHFSIAKRHADGVIEYIGKVEGADAAKAAFSHDHTHVGPDGVPHRHPHSHAAGTAPHDEFHEGQPHAHSHTEESVTENDDEQAGTEQTPVDDGAAAEKAADAPKCDKCGGSGKLDDAVCDKCGGSGEMKATKLADGEGDEPESSDDSDESEKGKPFPGAAEPFGGKKPKKAKAKAVQPDEIKAADDKPAADPNVGGGVVREDIPRKDYVFPEDAPDGGFPIVNAGDVEDAVNSWGRYKGPRSFDSFKKRLTSIARRKGFEDKLPESWSEKIAKVAGKAAKKAAKKAARAQIVKGASGEVSYLLRQAHDATCAVYTTDVIQMSYPALAKNGVAASLGPTAQQAIYSMLANEVAEDGGQGDESYDIHKLAKAYHALVEVLSNEGMPADSDAETLFLAAREVLHDAFKAANTEALLGGGDSGPTIPSPSDPPSPAQYRRAYLTDGRQAQTASMHDVSVTAPIHPIEGEDFDRGPLTDGQQRSFADKLAIFHDALADWRPELCRMDTSDRSFLAPDPSGWFGSTRQPAESFDRSPDLQRIDNKASAGLRQLDIPKTAPAPGETQGVQQVSLSADPTLRAITQADVDAAVTRATESLSQKVTTLEGLVDQVANAGDPAQRAERGAAGFRGKAAQIGLSAKEERRKAARSRRRSSKVEFYKGLAATGGPAARTRAIEKLAKLGETFEDA